MTDTPTQSSQSDNKVLSQHEQAFALARQGDTTDLRKLLETGLKPDIQDANGNSLLMLAGNNGHQTTCQLLLDHGADINAVSAEGKTPLMLAAMLNQGDIVALLLENGADAYAKSADGLTALALARAMGAEAAVRPLAQHVELF